MKVCTKCRVEKALESFYKDARCTDGLRYHCKECSNSYTYAIREKSPEKIRHFQLMSKYGIGLTDYEAMFEVQLGVCAICGNPESDSRPLSVDHDHSTGKVRGLLCQLCNRMLGLAKDNTKTLGNAILYLEGSK